MLKGKFGVQTYLQVITHSNSVQLFLHSVTRTLSVLNNSKIGEREYGFFWSVHLEDSMFQLDILDINELVFSAG